MESLSSEDASEQQTDPRGSDSPSADISGSENCAELSGAASSSLASSPLGGELILWEGKLEKQQRIDLSEVEMMKERFAKLLLGEDMSGGGKGVSTALAISNAITNLSATVFGELWRLEPLAPMRKAMWLREMEWLVSVSDSIVELTPSLQAFPEGGAFEVMVPRSRSDLLLNLPALKKLDAMLLGILERFRKTEFWYVDRGIMVGEEEGTEIGACPSSSFRRPSIRQEDKWWLPCPHVPPNGLSEDVRKQLQQCRECANQILKAAMAINSGVLAEMEIPDDYLETLPKSGKSCLGEIIYRYITADQFSPECLLDCLDLSSEYQTLEIANRIEAALFVWKQKVRKSHPLHSKQKKSWSAKVKGLVSDKERSHFFAQRAEDILLSLKRRYPSLPQSVLDMNKIQYNKDVGQAILESYSRVVESLAFNIMARIDDLIYVDDATRKCSVAETDSLFNRGLGGLPIHKSISPSSFSVQNKSFASPFMTPSPCSSTPLKGSPGRAQVSQNKSSLQGHHDGKLEKLAGRDMERMHWKLKRWKRCRSCPWKGLRLGEKRLMKMQ